MLLQERVICPFVWCLCDGWYILTVSRSYAMWWRVYLSVLISLSCDVSVSLTGEWLGGWPKEAGGVSCSVLLCIRLYGISGVGCGAVRGSFCREFDCYVCANVW